MRITQCSKKRQTSQGYNDGSNRVLIVTGLDFAYRKCDIEDLATLCKLPSGAVMGSLGRNSTRQAAAP